MHFKNQVAPMVIRKGNVIEIITFGVGKAIGPTPAADC
jgi:hypothetical protein